MGKGKWRRKGGRSEGRKGGGREKERKNVRKGGRQKGGREKERRRKKEGGKKGRRKLKPSLCIYCILGDKQVIFSMDIAVFCSSHVV